MTQPELGDRLLGVAGAIERFGALDRPASALEGLGRRVLGDERARSFLQGRWLGHAFHPLATDFPLGSWMSASLLDLVGGKGARKASERLIASGLLAAVPTAAAGLADWSETEGDVRRVGVVHASTNTTAALLYGSSLLARRKKKHMLGVTLGLAGGVVATMGGYLGGHLSLGRAVGTGERGEKNGPSVHLGPKGGV